MDSLSEKVWRAIGIGGLGVVGTAVFALVFLNSGCLDLNDGGWYPVLAAGAFSTSIYMLAFFGGGKLLEQSRPNDYSSSVAKWLSALVWFLFLGAGAFGLLFASALSLVHVHIGLVGIVGILLLSAINGLGFAIGGAIWIWLLERFTG